MRTFALVGVCLLFGVLAGVVLRPDDGTQVSLSPAETGAVVSGADHAKPLPRVPTPAVDIVREFIPEAQITFDGDGGLEDSGTYLVDNSRLRQEFDIEYPPFRTRVLEIINDVRRQEGLPTIAAQ